MCKTRLKTILLVVASLLPMTAVFCGICWLFGADDALRQGVVIGMVFGVFYYASEWPTDDIQLSLAARRLLLMHSPTLAGLAHGIVLSASSSAAIFAAFYLVKTVLGL
jgi:hypothetical protein